MRPLLALVVKDLTLHGRGVVAYAVGYTLAARVLRWLLPPLDSAGPPAIMFPIALYFVLVCVGWLVERERSRETFALLRALPVSDLAIVGSKFVAYLLMQAFGFLVALLGFPFGDLVSPMQLATVFVAMYVFAGLMLAVQLSCAGRRALIGPMLLMVGAVAAAARLSRSPELVADAVRLWSAPWFHAAFWSVGVLATAALVFLTWLRLRSQDTQDLVG